MTVQLISWIDGEREHVVPVEDPYDALSVARAARDDLGVEVYVAGRAVEGKTTQRDRQMFDAWQRGDLPPGEQPQEGGPDGR